MQVRQLGETAYKLWICTKMNKTDYSITYTTYQLVLPDRRKQEICEPDAERCIQKATEII
jgi:hypothetical protein